MTKRFFLVIAASLSFAGGFFFLLKPNQARQAEKALGYLKQNKYEACETLLNSLASSKVPVSAMYMGFLEQMQEKFDMSDAYFNRALQHHELAKKNEYAGSIYFAKASNAYFENRDQEAIALIESGLQYLNHPYFAGLAAYLQQNYSKALKLWRLFQTESLNGSMWLSFANEKLFPPALKQIHFAHSLIEEGDLAGARELLEKSAHQTIAENVPLHHLANLFLGLTYLKEANQISYEQQGSMYELSRFYFQRVQIDPKFFREKFCVTSELERETLNLLAMTPSHLSLKWGFDCIRTLLDWNATASIEQIIENLAYKILRHENDAYSGALCEAIRKEFLGSSFHVLLTQKLLSSVAQGIKDGQPEELFRKWALVETLSSNAKVDAKQIATLTFEEILNSIKRDDKMLSKTTSYLAFWETLERSPEEKELMAKELLVQAKLFWQNEKQEKKGEGLMAIALRLSNGNSEIQKEIDHFLTHLYINAEESNLIRRLSLIHDAMHTFHIKPQELASKSKIANHLADAEFLYTSRNYPAAKAHATWVLKLDPENEKATRLLGLCSFHMGEYTKALNYLNRLQNWDDYAKKAWMLSQVFATQAQEKHICQIDLYNSFSENE